MSATLFLVMGVGQVVLVWRLNDLFRVWILVLVFAVILDKLLMVDAPPFGVASRILH